jgi:ABC-type multidrug transport system fused ATPase/permease subunit
MRTLIELIKKSFARLSPQGKKVVFLYTFGLIAVSALDGMALYILASILDRSGQSEIASTSESTGKLLAGIIALFVLRSLLAIVIYWKSTKAFAREETYIGTENFRRLSSLPWQLKQSLNQSDYYSLVDRGPTNLVQGIILSISSLVAEVASGLVLLSVVMVMQPVTAASAAIYFATVAILQHKLISRSMKVAGKQVNDQIHYTLELLSDSFSTAKVMQVMPSQSFEKRLKEQRGLLAEARANLNYLASLPRYFMESVLALGFLTIAFFTALFSGQESVIPALVLFSAAGFRLLPSINRAQGLVLSLFGFAAQAEEVFRLEDGMLDTANTEVSNKVPFGEHNELANKKSTAREDPRPLLILDNVSYRYPDSNKDVLKNIDLVFEFGKQYAVVGPSGAGKTTLIDVILGLLQPTVGELIWNSDFGNKSLAYVPQESHLIKSTAFGNVALEWDDANVDKEKALESLESSRLDLSAWPSSSSLGLGPDLGPVRLKMSGGQRQRIGIARALYRDADLIVLDEATSALDAGTEQGIISTIDGLRGKKTAIIVAHRLTTIQKVDSVIYIDGGQIQGIGEFGALRNLLPQFDSQVQHFLIKD